MTASEADAAGRNAAARRILALDDPAPYRVGQLVRVRESRELTRIVDAYVGPVSGRRVYVVGGGDYPEVGYYADELTPADAPASLVRDVTGRGA